MSEQVAAPNPRYARLAELSVTYKKDEIEFLTK